MVGTSTYQTATGKRELKSSNPDVKGTWTCQSFRVDGYTCLKSILEFSYKNSQAVIEITDNHFEFQVQTQENSCLQATCRDLVNKLNATSPAYHFLTQIKVKDGISQQKIKFYTLQDDLIKLSIKDGKQAGSKDVSLVLNQLDQTNPITDVKSNTDLLKKIKSANVVAKEAAKMTLQLVTEDNEAVNVEIATKY